ncbi:MAG TPA: DNA circularization N-terminal domain-containing protein [Steroidobacteraceae bacterium]|nr:DNA circularization N-terminal domain-containing protein [Steroidobacteraceae bacterium]
MSWRDRLRPARLGSAEFQVEVASGQLGRRTQVHVYPNRDKPYVEDLGRRERRFTVQAYVIGPEYMAARNALIAELEKPGSKTLVHPYLGEMKVDVVEPADISESTREGGMARFSIHVVESGERVFPSATTDTKLSVEDKAARATQALQDSFANQFSTVRMPAFVSIAATNTIQDFADKLRAITRTVTTIPAKVTSFVSDLSDLSGAASSLILAPQTLASNIVGLCERLREIVIEPVAALDIVRSMFGYGDDFPAVPFTQNPARAQQATNQQAFVDLVQQTAAVIAAQISSTVQLGDTGFASLDDVIALRDELVSVLDDQAERAQSDDAYYGIVDVRTAMVIDLQTRGAPLARIVSYTLPESTSALVLAYDLYEDLDFEADLIARNAVRDPNFLPSGVPLEVLGNA